MAKANKNNDSFKEIMKIEDYSELKKIMKKYDNCEISENDLTEEEKRALIKLYDEEQVQLNQELATLKADIAKMLKKF